MNTSELRLLRVEVVGDLPVLWATFQRLNLPAALYRQTSSGAPRVHWTKRAVRLPAPPIPGSISA